MKSMCASYAERFFLLIKSIAKGLACLSETVWLCFLALPRRAQKWILSGALLWITYLAMGPMLQCWIWGCPKAPDMSAGRRKQQIFVSIVSTGSTAEDCALTLRRLFESAQYPDSVQVGLAEYNQPQNIQCLEAYCKLYGVHYVKKTQIRRDVVKLSYLKERHKCPRFNQIQLVAANDYAYYGVSRGRAMLRNKGHTFCLRVRPTTVFTNEWDETLIRMWHNIGNEHGVLSTKPPVRTSKLVPRLCRVDTNSVDDARVPTSFTGMNAKIQKMVETDEEENNKPGLTAAWSTNFVFSKCHLEEAVPFDPLLFLSDSDVWEFARLWTHGYDVYRPTSNVVFQPHASPDTNHVAPTYRLAYRHANEEFGEDRLKKLWGGKKGEGLFADLEYDHGLYGLGTNRTMRQLEKFWGWRKGTPVKSGACEKTLQWVPPRSVSQGSNDHLSPSNQVGHEVNASQVAGEH